MTYVTAKISGTFAIGQQGSERGAHVGVDFAPMGEGEGEQFVRIEIDQLYRDAALGHVIQIGPDGGAIFLDRGGLDAAFGDLSEPIEIGLIRPENGQTGYMHGKFLSLVCCNSNDSGCGRGEPPAALRETLSEVKP